MDNLRDYRAEQIAHEAAKRLDMTNGTEYRTNGITSEDTLLPCPFCGGEAKAFQQGDVGHVVQCRRCGIWNAGYHAAWSHITEDEFNGFIDEESAVAAWNTRAQTVFGMTLDEVRQMMERDAERERTCRLEYPKGEYIYRRERISDGVYSAESTGVEIVRCRDCSMCVKKGYRLYCDLNAGGFPEVEPDGFCAWGERNVVEE